MEMHKLIVGLLAALVAPLLAQQSFHTTPPPITGRFSCSGRRMGYYADLSTNCRAYHTCDDHGNHFEHYCPEGTAFRQDALICDHAHQVDCEANVAGAALAGSLDNSHDAPASSFAEPRGEGTNGLVRSFKINADNGPGESGKHTSFELNSSVFLTDRERAAGQTNHRARSEQTNEPQRANRNQNQGFQPHQTTFTSTPSTTISEELQPPVEPREDSSGFDADEYSFLVAPPIRDDNVFFNQHSNSFDGFRGSEPSDSFELGSSSDFQQTPRERPGFGPQAKTTPETPRGRALDADEFALAKPKNILEPPLFHPDFRSAASSNAHPSSGPGFSDYPYVETLRSIQNSRAASGGGDEALAQPSTRSASPAPGPSTDASIFAVPAKPLASGDDYEQDPYYPRSPTTTEAYYTPRHQDDKLRKPSFASTRRPAASNAKLEIPAVLPDLNSLEDLLDRRKFFFIPSQAKSV